MLHILASFDTAIPVYFINTGFHFPETLEFRDRITEKLALNVIDTASVIPKSQQLDRHGNLLFTSNPDYCCYLNKTQPMEPILAKMDVWINGVRADQNSNRRRFGFEETTPGGNIRFHPMIDWTSKMIWEYRKHFNLPEHPLDAKGYFSVGCEPCTQRMDDRNSRDGRWAGMKKNECGLHTDLIRKRD